MSELSTAILIVGGGTGGVAAALAVARRGRSCIVTEPTDWVGGQLTSQAVPPDEHPWIEGKDGFHGATASYIQYRSRVRRWYREHGHLTPQAAADPLLNPGGGWVSRLCHSPAVGHSILREMLAERVAAGQIRIIEHAAPTSADIQGGRVRAITFDTPEGDLTIAAAYVLDATELGDLLPMTSCDHRLGSEGRDVFGEYHAPEQGHRDDVQAITWCFAIENRPGEDHRSPEPAGYDEWKAWVPPLTPPWPGPLFSWRIDDATNPRTLNIVPPPGQPDRGKWELWHYRQIVESDHHTDNRPSVALWNTVQTDYFRSTPFDDPDASHRARQQALCFIHWLQNDCPRHDDDGHGYAGIRLRGDELGTGDGFAKAPYIREARRMVARVTTTEQHVGFQQRSAMGLTDTSRCELGTGEPFADSVGVGHYPIDLHPSAVMRNSTYIAATPFRVPLGALLPTEGHGPTNLIAAGKCLGVSHIANGCTRLHPVEWTVGEAAGALAAWCLSRDVAPAAVHAQRDPLREFQQDLINDGFELAWPWGGENL